LERIHATLGTRDVGGPSHPTWQTQQHGWYHIQSAASVVCTDEVKHDYSHSHKHQDKDKDTPEDEQYECKYEYEFRSIYAEQYKYIIDSNIDLTLAVDDDKQQESLTRCHEVAHPSRTILGWQIT
jgi:hypothetical protein